ncbi:Stem-specific protein [Actinidia chinensis var. chinensis]|uniref:Stem-specific protein n=1 Tax=Actinidia chinensis var. chinensis TaxID=1590841 RepID=A0A2R6P5Y7_ACTCC|nr:Stem-specific protein [Actinidia chinensis var. chinensis]
MDWPSQQMRWFWSLRPTRPSVTEHPIHQTMSWGTLWATLPSLSLTSPPPPCLWLLINLVRCLCIGESLLMGMWPLPMMLICLKVLVASLLLLSLKDVSTPQQLEN